MPMFWEVAHTPLLLPKAFSTLEWHGAGGSHKDPRPSPEASLMIEALE